MDSLPLSFFLCFSRSFSMCAHTQRVFIAAFNLIRWHEHQCEWTLVMRDSPLASSPVREIAVLMYSFPAGQSAVLALCRAFNNFAAARES